jgi:ATP-binding cassette subfamily F protein 3
MNQTRVDAIRAVLGIIAQPSWRPGGALSLPGVVARYNAPEDPMSLLAATDLTKSFGAHDVLRDVTVALAHQSRTALVGANGVGKTTLLALLAGEERPDRGRIQRARGLRIGYLPQDGSRPPDEDSTAIVWDYALQAFADLQRKERDLSRLEAAMADPHRTEEALASYGPLQETFERDGGYTYVGRTRQVLRGLGLPPPLWDRRLTGLSGGERARVTLARLLLEDPGLLLLDEPTNHLDLDALEWLETWLRDWPGAALVVSHDRFFLDRVAATVWELSADGISIYPGNYSAYLRQRADRRLEQSRRYRAQQTHLRSEQEYIRRNIAGQNTRQAKGRRKRLERWLEQEAIDRPADAVSVGIRLAAGARTGEQVLETADLVVAHPTEGSALFAVPNLALQRGECVAVLGPNGAGKTSLLRTLLGESAPYAGRAQLGPAVRPGYLSQSEAELRPMESVLGWLRTGTADMKDTAARSWLARFGLQDDAEKNVGQLSGGERRRLALAKLGLSGANLLILDEPTNNLDLPAQEALQETLADFSETILLATHDRYLAGALATQVWVISPNEASLDVFRGSLDEYFAAKEARHAAPAPVPGQTRKKAARQTGEKAKALSALEGRIEQLERSLESLAKEMDLARGDATRVTSLGIEYAERERELAVLMEAWAQAAGGEEPA